jgi:hypothetical protein
MRKTSLADKAVKFSPGSLLVEPAKFLNLFPWVHALTSMDVSVFLPLTDCPCKYILVFLRLAVRRRPANNRVTSIAQTPDGYGRCQQRFSQQLRAKV